MAGETNARIEFSVASVEEWEKVNPKLHQGEPVFAKKPSGKYILKVGAPGGSTYKNAVVVWDQDDAETKMENAQTAATEALASKNAAAASASAAKTSETAAAASKSAAATSAANAETSETNAAASKASAANSASTASTKATSAGNSASAAAASEKSAASSASAAATSERNALKSANAASTSADNAKTSETSAAASAKAAKQSEENAKTWDPTQYVKMENVKSIIKSMLLVAFPVGTIIESMNDVNPSTYIGGVWEKLPAGYATISAGTYTENHDNTLQSFTYVAGSTYGEAEHKLTTEEMPAHNHRNINPLSGNETGPYAKKIHTIKSMWEGKYEENIAIYMENTGGNHYHNNLPPSLAVYRFKRIT